MIKQTIEQYLPKDNVLKEEIVNSPSYKKIIKRAEIIDNFVSEQDRQDFPDVLKMTRDIILSHTSNMRNPEIVSYKTQKLWGYNFPVLFIASNGEFAGKDGERKVGGYYMLGIKSNPWFTIETETPANLYIGSIAHILAVNDEKIMANTKYNAMIFKGRKLYPQIAYPIIKDFTLVRDPYRDDRIIKYAEYKDKVEHTDANTKEVQELIDKGRPVLQGIDAKTIKIYKEISKDTCIGCSTEFNNNSINTDIEIRIEKPKYIRQVRRKTKK